MRDMLKGAFTSYLRIYIFAPSYACTLWPGPEARGPGVRGCSPRTAGLGTGRGCLLPGIGLQRVPSDGIALGEGGSAGFRFRRVGLLGIGPLEERNQQTDLLEAQSQQTRPSANVKPENGPSPSASSTYPQVSGLNRKNCQSSNVTAPWKLLRSERSATPA